MKNWLRYILILLAVGSLQTVAQAQVRDSVYFYDTWEQMLNVDPSTLVVSPVIECETPYAVDIYTTSDDYRLYDHLAATLDDMWLISSTYLRKNFKGDIRNIEFKYMPLYFNDKIAYFYYVGYGKNLSLKDLLYGEEVIDYSEIVDLYYIDFKNHMVRKVTPEVLSELLEDYHDLKMRYEGMKNYKKREIIFDYFFKYVERATDDIMRPFILDLVKE